MAVTSPRAAGIGLHSSYTAVLQGTINQTCRGRAEFGPIVTGPDARCALTLGLEAEEHSIAFAWTDPGLPSARPYPVIPEHVAATSAVRALVITGPMRHPTGVFRADRGTLTITSSSAQFLTGTFELHATGWLTRSPDDDGREIVALGSFVASARRAHADDAEIR